MSKPPPLDSFARQPAPAHARMVTGLSADLDLVAARAAESHRFLRHGWFAAAVAAYGGRPRTLMVAEDAEPVLALPLVALGPAWLGVVQVPGSYWPWRSFPLARGASPTALAAALRALAGAARGLRIGPVPDGDPAVEPLLAGARAAGWAVIDRPVARSWLLDLPARDWPRGSTLRKNRFHEKHLGEHGTLDWRFLSGADWPGAFDQLAAVEDASWIASRTDGRDAKFTATGHGAFWRAAAADPVLAAGFSAALLTVDGRPAAFSFDLNAGATRYAIANSFDPAFARHSPGKLLQYRTLVAARAGGTTLVDWGMGDSGYKQTLGARAGPVMRDWLLLRPGLPALAGRLIARWLSRAAPAVR